jgi:hypothetical protein
MQRFSKNTKSQNPENIGDLLAEVIPPSSLAAAAQKPTRKTDTSAARKPTANAAAAIPATAAPNVAGLLDALDDDDDLESVTKYELSLAEFPIFFLTRKIPKDVESINYKDTIYVNNQPVERHWKVTWSKAYGAPSQSVSETFFALYQIWAESGFDSTWVHFKTINALLKRKGLTKNQLRYKQTIRDLHCLSNIYIEAKNAFYDTAEKKYVDMSFHLFENVILEKNNKAAPDGKSKGYIRASKLLFAAAKNNSFNFGVPEEIFYKLPGLQQRLCLYLKKMFLVYPDYVIRNINDLATQIPLLSSPRLARFQIKKAAEALIKAKVIPGFSKISVKGHTICFERPLTRQMSLFEDSSRDQSIQARTADQNSLAEYNYEIITELCRDTEKSGRFYRLVAARMDTDDITRAISETKEFARTCPQEVDVPRVFTSRIKDIASKRGISLTAKQKRRAAKANDYD